MRVLLMLALLAIAAPAQAVSINYGDYVGITVSYLQVTEDSVTDPTPLFGAPTVSGDTLNFDPVGFGASATGAGGVDITDGNLVFMIQAKPSQVIENVILSEAGDYTIFGTGGVGTQVTVSAPVFIDIVEVDGVGINPIQLQLQMVFAPSDGDYDLSNDGVGVGVIWNGSLDVDLNQALIDANQPFVDGVTKVNVDLDNILTATSETGTSATIAKKDFKGFSVTVPEPSMLLLLATGAAGLIRYAHSRRPL